jgi:hypothetical protein
MDKLVIKKVERELGYPCDHDKTHIIELLTGRISNKSRELLALRLDECSPCRNLLSELSLKYGPDADESQDFTETPQAISQDTPVSSPEIEAQWREIRAQWSEIREQWAEIRQARREVEKLRKNSC